MQRCASPATHLQGSLKLMIFNSGKPFMPEILNTGKAEQEHAVFARAAEILATGGIIAYPTETFYGLGADATNEDAIRKIYAIKGRNFKSPLAVIIDQAESLYSLVCEVPGIALKLIREFWPGALTIVFRASDKILPVLTAGTGKIGVRVSGHPGARAIAQLLGGPVTATSANLSGAAECSEASEVIRQIGDKIDAVIDSGKTPGGKGSTIIDITQNPPVILREGIISGKILEKYISIQ
jgi:L-threonylcarbamoyladenylate synthase